MTKAHPSVLDASIPTSPITTVKGRVAVYGDTEGNLADPSSPTVSEKTNTLKSVFQAWEQIGDKITAGPQGDIRWTNLGYSKIRMVGSGFLTATEASFGIQLSSDNGATWVASYQRVLHSMINSTSNVATEINQDRMWFNAAQSILNSEPFMFEAQLELLSTGTLATRYMSRIVFHGNANGDLIATSSYGRSSAAFAVNALRLFPTSGNIIVTDMVIEGVR